jgi:Flp pilus assembly pilin Flp
MRKYRGQSLAEYSLLVCLVAIIVVVIIGVVLVVGGFLVLHLLLHLI